ncbi:heavy metal-associated isoprenylated plant protein 35-like [Abrus precatorius]|uniref:Heavy metal-associated isoprenylated plant protein 35-like n=1 Tax=Abrus precatorius TaxID=3816 RepID=A0A8B8K3F8_ABRPR|nr:heavy metal-associated isoprenylated plant protein 35-like [Abrus precatorius]
MDAKPSQLVSQPLTYQTWFLKVSIHCEGCRRKVKKVLKSIDVLWVVEKRMLHFAGVFTATIDPHQQKVTVTGSVGVETLLRKLVRAGKHAEIWPENLDGKGKITGKGEKNKKNEQRESKSLENKGTENSDAKCESSDSKTGDNSPGKSPAVDQVSPEGGQGEGGGGGSSKNKKKKGPGDGNGSRGVGSAASGAPAHTGFQFQNLVGQQMGQVNLSPTRQQSFSYPESGYYPPMFYVATYNRLYPMARIGGPSYYVPSSPYTCAGLDQDNNYFQSAPLVSFEIFSDENANGCSIM